ncbi:MAG: ScyD/ScyE family protein [Candidatus Solibacter usitatus]|nr:ScyD/ScyE family protein [Candidatus Solibacter usitatus]
MILTPSGNFLVSEPSTTPNAGRVSFVTRGGVRRTLLDGLPTGIEVTMAGASGPSAMALRERTLYLAFGPGDSERRGPPPTSMHNPQGASSPIFSSILEFRFSVEPDSLAGAFRMTPAHQQTLGDGGEVELTDGSGGTARVSLLARFPVSEPSPNVVYRFSNPWGMALTKDGRSLYVTDASTNALARIDTATGRWRRITRFPPVSNPAPVGPPVIDIVPTSVRLYGDELLISFLTGFPFAPGNARILSLNPETGTTNPFIFGLTSATDVLWRMLPDGASQFFVLEFSANQSASPAPPGRLLRFDASGMQVLAAPLITPVSMAYDEAAKELFILELRGQILRLRLE